ncbi:MAG: hypothetical protein ABID04_00790 [Patescibacteria group bacterium]
MNQNKQFDPVEFLELKIKKSKREEIRKKLFIDMAKYLLERFVDELSIEQLREIKKQKTKIKTQTDVFTLIAKMDSEFENKKPQFLKDYKEQFDFKRFVKTKNR